MACFFHTHTASTERAGVTRASSRARRRAPRSTPTATTQETVPSRSLATARTSTSSGARNAFLCSFYTNDDRSTKTGSGQTLENVRGKGVLCRDPRFGRASEDPSEDPYLAGHYASEWLQGSQQKDANGKCFLLSSGACLGKIIVFQLQPCSNQKTIIRSCVLFCFVAGKYPLMITMLKHFAAYSQVSKSINHR